MSEAQEKYRDRLGSAARDVRYFHAQDRDWSELEPTLRSVFIAQAGAVASQVIRDLIADLDDRYIVLLVDDPGVEGTAIDAIEQWAITRGITL